MALETKYGLAELTGGTSKERALEVFVAACNKIDTLFITDSWFASRDAKLRQLLSDPITGEQAEALLDAVLKRQRLDYLLDHVIEWLEHTCDMSWRKFTEHKEQLDAVERMYQEEDLLQKHIEWLEELKAMPRPTCPTGGRSRTRWLTWRYGTGAAPPGWRRLPVARCRRSRPPEPPGRTWTG